MNCRETMPLVLQEYVNDTVHALYQEETAEKIHERMDMPLASSGAIASASHMIAPHKLVAPHLHYAGAIDPQVGIVSTGPFATGLDDNMYTRAEYMANTMGMNTLALGSLAVNFATDRLSSDQRRRVADGDYTPVTDNLLRVVENSGLQTVHMFSYSQGVSTGLPLADKIHKSGIADVRTSAVVEAPNAQKRSTLRLAKDFIDTKPAAINTAINATGLPGYIALRNFGLGQLATFARSAAMKDNIAMGRGMRHNQLIDSMRPVLAQGTWVDHVRMQHSSILAEDSFSAVNQEFDDCHNFDSYTIPDFGHEGGDQIVISAAIMRRVITARQQFSDRL